MYLCDHVIVHAYLLFDLLLSEVWYAGIYDICLVKYVVATAMYFSSGIYMWPCSDEWIMSWINNTSPSVVYIYIYVIFLCFICKFWSFQWWFNDCTSSHRRRPCWWCSFYSHIQVEVDYCDFLAYAELLQTFIYVYMHIHRFTYHITNFLRYYTSV